MATPYTIRPGETLSSIARNHGMTLHDLYNLPDNAAFRRRRPNPDHINAGDVVMVPQRHGSLPARSIGYNVPLIPQTTAMGCWAAGMAMILAWRDHRSIDPSAIARNPGAVPYLAQLQTGLNPSDTSILRRWGLEVEAPQSYTVEGFAQLLERYGPLWVAAAVPGPHIRVVTGFSPDAGQPGGALVGINDPWERGMAVFRWPNRGSRYALSYVAFTRQVESLGSRELTEAAPVYVAHLR